MSRRSSEMNGCPQASRIDPLLDGRLDAEARRAMVEHLHRCENCREERAHLIALRRMSRALPRRAMSADSVQAAKSALQERNRGARRQRRSPGEVFADLFEDRPLALHGTAIAAGLVISMLCYGLGRFHEARFEPAEREGQTETADASVLDEAPEPRRFEPRIEALIDPTEGSARRGRRELVIESFEEPTTEPPSGDFRDQADDGRAPIAVPARLDEAPVDSPRVEDEPKPLRPLHLATRPVKFSTEALEVLEKSGSVTTVAKEIGEAAPNWAKLLSEGLLGGSAPANSESRSVVVRRGSRDMVVLLEDGSARLRLHITIVFGVDMEPQVQIRRAEAGTALAPDRPGR